MGGSRQFSVAETLATNLVVAAVCCVWFKYGQGVCTGPAAPLGRPTARRKADCPTCTACVGAPVQDATRPSAKKSGAHDDGYAHVDTIKEAFTLCDTDKLWRHGYHRHYENWLLPYKNKAAFDMLEIGTKDGQSLVSWMLYFNDISHVDAMRYGEPGKWDCQKAEKNLRVDCDKIHIFEGDQSAKADLQAMKDARPEGWDIIIDDGSHVPMHNIISFKLLWNSIKPANTHARALHLVHLCIAATRVLCFALPFLPCSHLVCSHQHWSAQPALQAGLVLCTLQHRVCCRLPHTEKKRFGMTCIVWSGGRHSPQPCDVASRKHAPLPYSGRHVRR